jgi:hypothetical protein
MPVRSKSQWRKLHVLAKQGKISQQSLKHFKDATPSYKVLPEKVKESDQSWETPNIAELIAQRQEEDAAPGMAGANVPGVTTSVNAGPYQVPLGGMLRRVVPGWSPKKGRKRK